MQLVASLGSLLLLLLWSLRASALPAEERVAMQSTREQSATRRDAVLRVLAALLDGAAAPEPQPQPEEDAALAGLAGLAVPDGDRATPGRMSQLPPQLPPQLPQLPPRDRKAPCKNFFWKTFTSC